MNVFASRRLLPLQIALWLVPLAGVVLWARTQDAPSLPGSTGGYLELCAALAVYVVATLVRSERWHSILHAERVDADRADVYALVPVGYMGNNALPARSGELLRVFLLGSRTGASKRTILGTVLVERLLDAIALGLLLVLLAFNLASKLRVPNSPALLVAIGAVVVLSVITVVVVLRSERLRARARHLIVPMLVPARQLLGWRGAALLVVTVGIWVLEAGVYVLVGEAVDIHLGLHGGLSVVAFTNLCALVPAAPGYIGTFDAAVVFAVRTVTGTAAKLTSYLLLLRFVLFVPITVVGLVILFVRYGGLARLRAARAQQTRERESVRGGAEPVTGEIARVTPA
jgi:glycosyltransferase 2 family protein